MSEFLLIVPEGWTQLDWAYLSNNVSGLNHPQVMDWVATGYMLDLEIILKEQDVIPDEASLISAKLIDDTYFLVKLG